MASYVELAQPATRAQAGLLAAASSLAEEKAELTRLAAEESYPDEVLAQRASVLDLLESFSSCAIALPISSRCSAAYDGTALIAAAHLGHDGVVRQLIRAGAPLDHVNNLHWTALIEAIVLGDGGPRHTAVLRALVEAGASLELADGDGRTPLASSRRYTAMERILRGAGAR